MLERVAPDPRDLDGGARLLGVVVDYVLGVAVGVAGFGAPRAARRESRAADCRGVRVLPL